MSGFLHGFVTLWYVLVPFYAGVLLVGLGVSDWVHRRRPRWCPWLIGVGLGLTVLADVVAWWTR